MAKAQGAKIIIVKKVKKGGHAHHGGSWKVAYADFVTAMMAFFMVMWILGMDQNVRKAIEGYFANPIGFKKGYSAGSSPISAGSSPASVRSDAMKLMTKVDQTRHFEQASSGIRRRLTNMARAGGLEAHVEIIVTSAGLRIELVEGEDGQTFFTLASADLKPEARLVLEAIGAELSALGNPVVVEGHTDAAQYGGRVYSNWELSADRANAARRILEASGIPRERVQEVRGLADRHLRIPDDPYDARNRRISVFLPFVTPPDLPNAPDPGSALPAAPALPGPPDPRRGP